MSTYYIKSLFVPTLDGIVRVRRDKMDTIEFAHSMSGKSTPVSLHLHMLAILTNSVYNTVANYFFIAFARALASLASFAAFAAFFASLAAF